MRRQLELAAINGLEVLSVAQGVKGRGKAALFC